MSVHRRLCFETAADDSTNRLDRFTYDNYLCVARNRWQPDGTSATDRFVWDPTEPVATRPLAFYQPNAPPQLYAHDGNKNVSELVTADNGTITAHYEYASFGDMILTSGDLELSNPFRFSSECSDDALGLVYYNYRHYEPVTGRWMRRDVMEEDGGMNLFSFVNNRSSDYKDFIGGIAFPELLKIGLILQGIEGVAAAIELLKGYMDMRLADVIGSDKWFHCVHMCKAARHSQGITMLIALVREGSDLMFWSLKDYLGMTDCQMIILQNS